MALIRGSNLHLDFGHGALLDNASFVIQKGQHIGLVGRNGEGKSSFLKLLNGDVKPESGILQMASGVTIRRLSQEVPVSDEAYVFSVVAEGLGDIHSILNNYQQLSTKQNLNDKEVTKLQSLHDHIDGAHAWDALTNVNAMISKMSLPGDKRMKSLSGGMRRRVLLAQCLLAKPDILLLDEPTNHLDIEAIQWLEELLQSFKGAFIIVSHDRAFLKKVAKQIIDIDRGKLTTFNGDYDFYLKQKELQLNAIEKEQARFDKRLSEEEVWIRQGIKARRTRNEGRVRALKAMREARGKRRALKGTLSLSSGDVAHSGKIVFEAKAISYQIDNKPIIQEFSATVLRGDKIGIVGPNGCGKSTLLNLLLENLKPTSGQIKRGTNLQIAYFDQLREAIDEEKTVMDVVAEGSQTVNVFGVEKHIISFLGEFLFSPDRCRSPVKYLSGGEKNRLFLARLFTRNANIFIFDEPTNDLDIESLEMLEAFMVDFPGTVIIVSHDRVFLDNVCGSIWHYEGNGCFGEHVGGYTDTLLHTEKKSSESKIVITQKKKIAKKAVLTPEEKRELKRLPKQIEALEVELEKAHDMLADSSIYEVGNEQKYQALASRAKAMEAELDELFTRWDILEGLQKN